ncbi:hypothetical protein DN752_22575 [Echinicola strongylocentroti]|uniref:Uncharacterized protein n=1 Tax=Echinicola strongylocentroti TaxID=1795355 RepID=A0A2Z4IPI1_9BACT|nr:hypothetical protein [Echinicola strongylocentroti]AWW32704.1 hypothetical protein DN752_22575 [Echinicola strongylocentroti]
MKKFRNIFTVVALVAIYSMATTVVCCFQNKIDPSNQSEPKSVYQVDDLLGYVNHAYTAKYATSIPVPPPFDPSLFDVKGDSEVESIHAFQFKRLYQRQLSNSLKILIEQNKANLLYQFYFFF